jgi:hypothetical protein
LCFPHIIFFKDTKGFLTFRFLFFVERKNSGNEIMNSTTHFPPPIYGSYPVGGYMASAPPFPSTAYSKNNSDIELTPVLYYPVFVPPPVYIDQTLPTEEQRVRCKNCGKYYLQSENKPGMSDNFSSLSWN